MIDEEWKVVKDFTGYSISNRGQVKSQKELWSLLMKPSKDKDGYFQI